MSIKSSTHFIISSTSFAFRLLKSLWFSQYSAAFQILDTSFLIFSCAFIHFFPSVGSFPVYSSTTWCYSCTSRHEECSECLSWGVGSGACVSETRYQAIEGCSRTGKPSRWTLSVLLLLWWGHSRCWGRRGKFSRWCGGSEVPPRHPSWCVGPALGSCCHIHSLDPLLCGYNYMHFYNMCEGVPTLVRSDYGTENCYVAIVQMALRHYHNDKWKGFHSFKYGKSTTNTVILHQIM